MIGGSLIGRAVRRMTRRYLSFGDADDNVGLPRPASVQSCLLYLHIPFCVVLCPFCSFHRVEYREQRARSYFDALRREISLFSDRGFGFHEVYVGGGTPTVLPGELIDTLALLRSRHPIARVSVETNPDDLDDERLPRLHDVGVNRLSVGVQSFDDALLKSMQRYDKYGSGARICDRLRRVRGTFDTLNVDMIFNIPQQTEVSLRRDLAILTGDVGADQVSFYPLMVTGTTRRRMAETMGAVNFRREERFYRIIVAHMADAGYRRSSAWCFSRDAGMIDEYITEQEDYLGLGSGAFSYLDGTLYASTFSINNYIRLVSAGRSGIVRRRDLALRDRLRYYLLMHLFSGSLDKAAAERYFGASIETLLRPELTALRLIGALLDRGTRFELTDRGYYLWTLFMREFFSGVNSLRDEMRLHIPEERSTLTTSRG